MVFRDSTGLLESFVEDFALRVKILYESVKLLLDRRGVGKQGSLGIIHKLLELGFGIVCM
jgi:hypothetical protein